MASVVTYDAVKYACKLLPKAVELVGDASATDRAQFATVAERLADEHGVTEPFLELAAMLIADGFPEVPSRLAAYWAARRFYGIDQRVAEELSGGAVSEFEIAVQQKAFTADREEAETRRFYREDFPAIAAARGQRCEDSRAWRMFTDNVTGGVAVVPLVPPAVGELQPLVDWPAEQIRNEYRRFWSTAERRFWDGEYQAAKLRAADELEAARYATRRVLDRRITIGTRAGARATA